VLFNPWAVRSNEALNSFDSPLMKLLARAIYAIVGVSVEKAIAPITHLIDNPPHTALSAFIKTKPVDLTMNTFDRGKAISPKAAESLAVIAQGLRQNTQKSNG
jgi:hypothetical protein